MYRLAAGLVLVQSALLLAAGFCTLWWSSDLMFLLIHLVGEERALGSENVIVRENGAKLLTNPGGMVLWTIPFWGLGLLHVTASVTLVALLLRRPRRGEQ